MMVALATLALSLQGARSAPVGPSTTSFDLVPRNATCLPDAQGTVTVFHKEEALGSDSLHLEAQGLPPKTDFAVFLTSADAFATPPFGAVQYIGDFTTNGAGKGSLKVDAIVDEAFSSTLVGDPPTRVRAELDHLVFWFADPAQVPDCFDFTGSTPFDGDGQAGPAAMSSRGPTGLEDFPD
jgi:hypothetical protein